MRLSYLPYVVILHCALRSATELPAKHFPFQLNIGSISFCTVSFSQQNVLRRCLWVCQLSTFARGMCARVNAVRTSSHVCCTSSSTLSAMPRWSARCHGGQYGMLIPVTRRMYFVGYVLYRHRALQIFVAGHATSRSASRVLCCYHTSSTSRSF